MKKNSFLFLALIFLLIFSLPFKKVFAANAQTTHVLMTAEELELRNKSKKKLYPGGSDEDPLKVQSQLNVVNRKVSPPSDSHEDAPATEPSDD